MKKKMGKIFTQEILNKNSFTSIEYDAAKHNDYYEFIKDNYDVGLNQFIITSEMMINLLNYYFLSRKFSIMHIEFMEESSKLLDEVQRLLEKIKLDRGHFAELVEKLKFISNQNSIDIKKIELKGKDTAINKTVRVTIQVNGIYEVDINHFEIECLNILNEIENYYDY